MGGKRGGAAVVMLQMHRQAENPLCPRKKSNRHMWRLIKRKYPDLAEIAGNLDDLQQAIWAMEEKGEIDVSNKNADWRVKRAISNERSTLPGDASEPL